MDQFILNNHILDGQNIMTIKNTNLAATNYVEGNSNYSLSKFKNCFCGFSSNSSKGTFTLTTVAGKTQNFNIASTSFFKNKLAEASSSVTGSQSSSINWSYSGNTISFSTTGVLTNGYKFPITGSNSTFGKNRYDAGVTYGRSQVSSVTASLSDTGITKSGNTVMCSYYANLSNNRSYNRLATTQLSSLLPATASWSVTKNAVRYTVKCTIANKTYTKLIYISSNSNSSGPTPLP